ncbi:hypothetical protein BDV96DRAFT_607578 [Lophiotrema nucula]|uniref:Uncharacterized protein n=1 Tax=Lophiotrema nucula TaxID=690887 RepID=A0A6A5YJ31_9PLEO|nr:hypothetical protein BDV96DRAFT_607578 [Lophiotrema nucula]
MCYNIEKCSLLPKSGCLAPTQPTLDLSVIGEDDVLSLVESMLAAGLLENASSAIHSAKVFYLLSLHMFASCSIWLFSRQLLPAPLGLIVNLGLDLAWAEMLEERGWRSTKIRLSVLDSGTDWQDAEARGASILGQIEITCADPRGSLNDFLKNESSSEGSSLALPHTLRPYGISKLLLRPGSDIHDLGGHLRSDRNRIMASMMGMDGVSGTGTLLAVVLCERSRQSLGVAYVSRFDSQSPSPSQALDGHPQMQLCHIAGVVWSSDGSRHLRCIKRGMMHDRKIGLPGQGTLTRCRVTKNLNSNGNGKAPPNSSTGALTAWLRMEPYRPNPSNPKVHVHGVLKASRRGRARELYRSAGLVFDSIMVVDMSDALPGSYPLARKGGTIGCCQKRCTSSSNRSRSTLSTEADVRERCIRLRCTIVVLGERAMLDAMPRRLSQPAVSSPQLAREQFSMRRLPIDAAKMNLGAPAPTSQAGGAAHERRYMACVPGDKPCQLNHHDDANRLVRRLLAWLRRRVEALSTSRTGLVDSDVSTRCGRGCDARVHCRHAALSDMEDRGLRKAEKLFSHTNIKIDLASMSLASTGRFRPPGRADFEVPNTSAFLRVEIAKGIPTAQAETLMGS